MSSEKGTRNRKCDAIPANGFFFLKGGGGGG